MVLESTNSKKSISGEWNFECSYPVGVPRSVGTIGRFCEDQGKNIDCTSRILPLLSFDLPCRASSEISCIVQHVLSKYDQCVFFLPTYQQSLLFSHHCHDQKERLVACITPNALPILSF